MSLYNVNIRHWPLLKSAEQSIVLYAQRLLFSNNRVLGSRSRTKNALALRGSLTTEQRRAINLTLTVPIGLNNHKNNKETIIPDQQRASSGSCCSRSWTSSSDRMQLDLSFFSKRTRSFRRSYSLQVVCRGIQVILCNSIPELRGNSDGLAAVSVAGAWYWCMASSPCSFVQKRLVGLVHSS